MISHIVLLLFLTIFAAESRTNDILDEDERDANRYFPIRQRNHRRRPPVPAGNAYQSFDEYILQFPENTIRLPEPNEYFEGEIRNGKIRNSATYTYNNNDNFEENERNERLKVSDRAILKKIQRNNVSQKYACCALGKMAGNHGFHCNARFYESSIQMRNRNRAQTRQTAFDDIEREPAYNERLWQTFGNCVWKHAKTFHHCCYAARVLGSQSLD